MLKLMGCLCLFLGCTGFGLYKARQYRERPRQLQLLRTAIQGLETEIEYGATPLPVALMRLSKRFDGPIASLLAAVGSEVADSTESTVQIFERVLRQLSHQVFLNKEDLEVVKQFAATLGISDRKDQLKHLKLASQNLLQLETRAAEDRVRLERMWNYLGPLVGALLIILFY